MNAKVSENQGKTEFIKSYNTNKAVFLSARVVDDLATPMGIYLRLIQDQSWHFLLESLVPNVKDGRYSIIGLDPDAMWTLKEGEAYLVEKDDDGFCEPMLQKQPPLESFKAFVDSVHMDLPKNLPGQSYGIYGYLGYDAVRLIEPTVADRHPSDPDLPDGIFIRPTIMAIFDRQEAMITLCVAARPKKGISANQAWLQLKEKLDHNLRLLNAPLNSKPRKATLTKADLSAKLCYAMTESNFHDMIKCGKEYIRQGDLFQIVLAQKFSQHFPLTSLDYYRALRRVNPSPYLFHFDCADHALVGSSPEVMVSLDHGITTIRPLAGSRPRGETKDSDDAYAEELLADPKERAEHLMLLDLARNDAGRHAQIDSVEVTKRFAVERYQRIMHISSTVVAQASKNAHPVDVLMSALPAGTVSGAPKVRAMQRIDEIEPSRRGFYAGTVGYFDALGNLDSCITLRTALWKDHRLHFQTGVGVVADSIPEVEYQESLHKLRAMNEAVGEAFRMYKLTNRDDQGD